MFESLFFQWWDFVEAKGSSSLLKEKVYYPYQGKRYPHTKQLYCAGDKGETPENGYYKGISRVDLGQGKSIPWREMETLTFLELGSLQRPWRVKYHVIDPTGQYVNQQI